jgi:hypothetical protein
MDAADRCVKEAERCERLAVECREEASRTFFMDAAAYWRRMALEAQSEKKQPATRASEQRPSRAS